MFHHTDYKNLYILVPCFCIFKNILLKTDQQISVMLTVDKQLVKSHLSTFQWSICLSIHSSQRFFNVEPLSTFSLHTIVRQCLDILITSWLLR